MFHGPFIAIIADSEKQDDKFIYSVIGMGGNEREEIEVLAGAPIIEWLAKGTEVLVVPHWLSKSELFIIARAHISGIMDELTEAGDFAIEREAGTYVLFKSGEITMEAATKLILNAPTIEIGDGATEAAVLGDILTTLLTAQKTYIDIHTHSGVLSGPNPTGAPSAPSPPVSNFKSTVVKIK